MPLHGPLEIQFENFRRHNIAIEALQDKRFRLFTALYESGGYRRVSWKNCLFAGKTEQDVRPRGLRELDVMASRKEGESKVAVVEPQALSVRDAAIYLGIGKSNVWNRVAAGEWPAFRVGRRLLIPKAHLDSLIGSASLENRAN